MSKRKTATGLVVAALLGCPFPVSCVDAMTFGPGALDRLLSRAVRGEDAAVVSARPNVWNNARARSVGVKFMQESRQLPPEPPPPGVPQPVAAPAPQFPFPPPVGGVMPGPTMPQGPAAAVALSEGPLIATSMVLHYFMILSAIPAAFVFAYLLFKRNGSSLLSMELSAGCTYYSAVLPAILAIAIPPAAVVGTTVLLWAALGWWLPRSRLRVRTFGFMLAASTLLGGLFCELVAGSAVTSGIGYTGLAGLIFQKGTAGTHKIVLAVLQLCVVAAASSIAYSILRGGLRREGKEEEAGTPSTFTWSRFVSCLVCSHAIAAGVSVTLYRVHACTYSSLDILSMFSLPTGLRLNDVSAYVNLVVWMSVLFGALWYRSQQTVAGDTRSACLVEEVGEEYWRQRTEPKAQDQLAAEETVSSPSEPSMG